MAKYKVLATRKNGNVRMVHRLGPNKFSLKKTKGSKKKMNKAQAKKAVQWAKKKGFTDIRRTRSKYPFLVLDSDTKWPKTKLARKLNKLAKRRKRYMFVNEGWRTHARQWVLWNAYQSGTGNLAAYPGTSNHEGGWAADMSVFLYGRDSYRQNVGEDDKTRSLMKKMGICLPVGGETWHCELGQIFRA